MKFYVTIYSVTRELTLEKALEMFHISVVNGFPVTIEAVK